MKIPPYIYLILYRPKAVLDGLERARQSGLVEEVPTPWQLALGVLRMWHRLVFRTETVGTCVDGRARSTLRARLLALRGFRLPALLLERAVAPLDFTGLLSSRERIIRHLLGAHHDGEKHFVYDLELLSAHPDGLSHLAQALDPIVALDTPRSRWLRDLVVFEGYHETLKVAVDRALEQGVAVPPEAREDPDLSFAAYLRWCARQPPTPAATLAALRQGRFTLQAGLRA